mmetsp:Transcript_36716/g.115003  ORF Transcript_36716/g.115003 Transcript_36716/m.115003 type:complete len:493 (-) Transcript_36716:84-1562(-)
MEGNRREVGTAATRQRRRKQHLQRALGREKWEQDVLSRSDFYGKRIRVPKVDLKANPYCADRQLEDMRELARVNRNPRLRELTKADYTRSAAYSGAGAEDQGGSTSTIEGRVLARKRRVLGDALGRKSHAAERHLDRLARNQARKVEAVRALASAKAAGLASPERGLANGAGAAVERPKHEIGDLPLMQPYSSTVSTTEPPSFGHRPRSASRSVDTHALAVNGLEDTSAANGRILRSRSQVMSKCLSVAELRELLGTKEKGFLDPARQLEDEQADEDEEYGMHAGGQPMSDVISELYASPPPAGVPDEESWTREMSTLTSTKAFMQSLRDNDTAKPKWDEYFASMPYENPAKLRHSVIAQGQVPNGYERIKRYHRLSVGLTLLHPLCKGRQEEDRNKMRSLEEKRKLKARRRKASSVRRQQAPPTPRTQLVNVQVRNLQRREAERMVRNAERIRHSETIDEWSRIPQPKEIDNLGRHLGLGYQEAPAFSYPV